MPTIDQARIIEQMWCAGKPLNVISKFARMSNAEVRRYVYDHKDSCPPRRQTVFNGTEREFIATAWNKGATIDQISDALNITRTSVTNYVGRHRDICPNKKQVNSRLSKERRLRAQAERAKRHEDDGPKRSKPFRIPERKVEQIIDCYKRGLSRNKIADECGVGTSTVGRYIKEWRLGQEAL